MKEVEEICSVIDPEKIEEALGEYDLILLVTDGAGAAENLTDLLCRSEALRKAEKKILILTEADVLPTDTYRCTFVKIGRKERTALERLYGMYEFSNRFRILSCDRRWGSILNYVKTGIMTLEEAFQVFLI